MVAIAKLKPLLRWLILGAALFFLASTVRKHWHEVAAIRLDPRGWQLLAIALLTTLLAHVWTGWVWGWILKALGQSTPAPWAIRTYLTTNIAKYLPGNVWHFYGRAWAAKKVGVPLAIAIVSVVLEPLLMAASALMVGLLGIRQAGWGLQALSLAIALALVHPRILNPVLHKLSRKKASTDESMAAEAQQVEHIGLQHYPVLPLLGELIFLGLRGLGFIWIVLAFAPIPPGQVLPVFSAFSFAWLLGLVVPGAPGGIGVFEATAIALLPAQLTPAVILSAVACYRLVSTLAEGLGAIAGWGAGKLVERH